MAVWSRLLKIVSTVLHPENILKKVFKKLLLRPTIAALKRMGMSDKELWSTMKNVGFAEHGKPITEDVSTYIHALDHITQVSGVPFNEKVPTDYMTETYLRSGRRYRYIAKAKVHYGGEAAMAEKYVSFYTDEWKPLNEYREDLQKIIDQAEYEGKYEILSLDYEIVLHQQGDTY